jgi:hypothetical protein
MADRRRRRSGNELVADHHHDTAPRGEEEQMRNHLPLDGNPRGRKSTTEIRPRPRTRCDLPLDDPDGALASVLGDAQLRKTTPVGRRRERADERMQPRVVRALHEMQRPAHQPRAEQRFVRRGAASAERQPRGTQVLRLHGEQVRGHGRDLRPVQQLGGRAAHGERGHDDGRR